MCAGGDREKSSSRRAGMDEEEKSEGRRNKNGKEGRKSEEKELSGRKEFKRIERKKRFLVTDRTVECKCIRVCVCGRLSVENPHAVALGNYRALVCYTTRVVG